MGKKIAVIDLGTNTFHILIASVEGPTFDTLLRERKTVKIGEDGISKGFITEAAQERALMALDEFKSVIDQHQVEKVYATATSAIRNAKNGIELVEKIHQRTGISVKIISGDEEAEYIYFGVKTALDIGKETSLVLDIGGGSVEFIICNQENIFWKKSFEIGAQRLLDLFHYHDPILPEEILKLSDYLGERLSPLLEAVRKYPVKSLIGSSGTFDTLSDIYRAEFNINLPPESLEFPLPMDKYNIIFNEIIHKNREERLKIPGMIEMRVEMIVVACCLISYVVEKLKIEDIRISAFSLKEGVLYSIIHQFTKNNG